MIANKYCLLYTLKDNKNTILNSTKASHLPFLIMNFCRRV